MYRIRGTIRAVCSGNQPPAQLTRQRGPLQCPSWALTRLQVWEAQRDLGPNPLTHHHRSVFPSSSTSRIAECQTASSRSCPGKSPTGARQHQREPRRRKGRARREFHQEIQGFRQKRTSESRWRRGRSRTCRCSSSSPTFSSRYVCLHGRRSVSIDPVSPCPPIWGKICLAAALISPIRSITALRVRQSCFPDLHYTYGYYC